MSGLYPTSNAYRPVDPVLQGVLSGLANDPKNFIADKCLPVILNSSRTPGQDSFYTGTIQRIEASSMFGDPEDSDLVSPLQNFPRSKGVQFDPMTYTCQKYGGEIQVSLDIERRMQGAEGYGYKGIALQKLVDQLRLKKEARVASLFQTAGNWTNSSTPANRWDVSAGTPMTDIDLACETVAGYGFAPNVAIFGRDAFRALRLSPAFLEFLPTNIDRNIADEDRISALLKEHFHIDFTFVGRARHRATAGSATLTDIWGDHAGFYFMPLAGSVGVRGTLPGEIMLDSTAAARVVSREWEVLEYDEPRNSCVIEQVKHEDWAGVVQPQLGYLLSNLKT